MHRPPRLSPAPNWTLQTTRQSDPFGRPVAITMSRPGLRSAGNTGFTPEVELFSEHEEETPVVSTHAPNPGPMPGFTAEQAASLQAMMSAQIAANNKVLLIQMGALMDARLGPEQHQMTAPVNPRFNVSPTPQPEVQSHSQQNQSNQQPHLQSNPVQPNQQPNSSSQSSPHDEQITTTNDTTTTRWRGEELGTFDPAVDDVYTFTNRMHQVAALRGDLLVQLNVSL